MQHTMTLFIADDITNKFMKSADLKPEYKWYVTPQVIDFRTSSLVDDQYFENIIKASKEVFQEQGFWIPAIRYQNNFYRDSEVKILSDGKKEVFIHES